jgi:hypothetical protein
LIAGVLSILILRTLMAGCGGGSGPTGVSRNLVKFINNTDRTARITIEGTAHEFDLPPGEKATKEVGESQERDVIVTIVLLHPSKPASWSGSVSVGQTVTIEGLGEQITVYVK